MLTERFGPPLWHKRNFLGHVCDDRHDAKDAAGAITAILEAVAAGDLTPSEASEVTKLLDTYVKVFEAVEIAERVERLEKMVETR